MNAKASSKIQPTLKKRAAGTSKMGVHKNAYSLYSGPGRAPRRGRVTVSVDPERVARAFGANRDAHAARTATVSATGVTFRPPAGYVDPQPYSPVILPYSKSITR